MQNSFLFVSIASLDAVGPGAAARPPSPFIRVGQFLILPLVVGLYGLLASLLWADVPVRAVGYRLELSDPRGHFERSETSHRFTMRDELKLVARPLEAVHRPVEASLFLKGPSEREERLWPVRLRHARDGVFTLMDRVDQLPPLLPGTWTLVLAVAPAGELPSTLRGCYAAARVGRLVGMTQSHLEILK